MGTIKIARDGGAIDVAILVLHDVDDAARLEVLHVGIRCPNLRHIIVQDDAPAQKVGHARAVCGDRGPAVAD